MIQIAMKMNKYKNNSKELDVLIAELMKLKNKESLHDFLLGILTPKERLEIPKRLAIVKMLKKGIQHQEIAEKLQVGVATVTRGSREIQKGRFKYVN
jgi:TrpR family transcriptional regulator, trp operon repressor